MSTSPNGKKKPPPPPVEAPPNITALPMELVHANDQDRTVFDPKALEELARQIEQVGLLQPITVRPCTCEAIDGDHYLIVMGERRFRAHQLLKAGTINGMVRNLDDVGHDDAQLIENIGRAELDPFDEAKAYRRRMDTMGLTVEQVADRYGKAAGVVQRKLDLLRLEDEIVQQVKVGNLPVGHAQCMTPLDSNRQRLAFAAFRKNDTMAVVMFKKLCDALLSEQEQDTLFDDDAFLRVDELVAEAAKQKPVGGRDLVRLTVDIGESMNELLTALDHNHIGTDELVGFGVDVDRMLMLIASAEWAKTSRSTALKTGASSSRRTRSKKFVE